MKRTIYIEDSLNKKKYCLVDAYNGFGIYQHKTPTGYFVHQDWAIVFDDTHSSIHKGNIIQIGSYNNCCKDELLDAIDNYNETGKFNFKAFDRGYGLYVVHPSGNELI